MVQNCEGNNGIAPVDQAGEVVLSAKSWRAMVFLMDICVCRMTYGAEW